MIEDVPVERSEPTAGDAWPPLTPGGPEVASTVPDGAVAVDDPAPPAKPAFRPPWAGKERGTPATVDDHPPPTPPLDADTAPETSSDWWPPPEVPVFEDIVAAAEPDPPEEELDVELDILALALAPSITPPAWLSVPVAKPPPAVEPEPAPPPSVLPAEMRAVPVPPLPAAPPPPPYEPDQELLDVWALAGDPEQVADDLGRERWVRRLLTPAAARWAGMRRGERVNFVLYVLTGVSILAMTLELLAGPDSLPTDVTTTPEAASQPPPTVKSTTTITFTLPEETVPPPVVTRAPVRAPSPAAEPEEDEEVPAGPDPETTAVPTVTTRPPATIPPTTIPVTTLPPNFPFPTPVPPVPPTFAGPSVPTVTTATTPPTPGT